MDMPFDIPLDLVFALARGYVMVFVSVGFCGWLLWRNHRKVKKIIEREVGVVEGYDWGELDDFEREESCSDDTAVCEVCSGDGSVRILWDKHGYWRIEGRCNHPGLAPSAFYGIRYCPYCGRKL